MTVYAIHEGVMGEGCVITEMYFDRSIALSYAISKVERLQNELVSMDHQNYHPWVENDMGVIKAWSNGYHEIYVMEYEVK